LKKWNGIFIGGADYLDFDFPGVDSGMISFASLFGVGTSNENFDLIAQNERVRGEIDFLNDFFVIGDDQGVITTHWRDSITLRRSCIGIERICMRMTQRSRILQRCQIVATSTM
jgi:hypothetical protein